MLANTDAIVPMIKVYTTTPKIIHKIAINISPVVKAPISPYPTVVSEVIAK
jgi:hypothetical protein